MELTPHAWVYLGPHTTIWTATMVRPALSAAGKPAETQLGFAGWPPPSSAHRAILP